MDSNGRNACEDMIDRWHLNCGACGPDEDVINKPGSLQSTKGSTAKSSKKGTCAGFHDL